MKLPNRVEMTSTCWLWKGPHDQQGYGLTMLGRNKLKAHRLSYMLFYGNIPDDLQIDHLCNNKSCINPEHLEAVTASENSLRATRYYKRYPERMPKIPLLTRPRKEKTHCLVGHEYTPENTILLAVGGKICRKCNELNVSKKVIQKRAKSS